MTYRETDFSQSFIVPPLYPEPHERMAKDTCLPQSGGGSCTRLWVPHKGIGLTPQDSPSICTHSCAVPSLPHPAQITQPGSLLQSSAPHAGHPVLAPGPHSVWQQSLGPLRTVCLNKSTSPRKSAHNQYLKRTTAISRHAAISWRGCCITSRRTSSPTTPPPAPEEQSTPGAHLCTVQTKHSPVPCSLSSSAPTGPQQCHLLLEATEAPWHFSPQPWDSAAESLLPVLKLSHTTGVTHSSKWALTDPSYTPPPGSWVLLPQRGRKRSFKLSQEEQFKVATAKHRESKDLCYEGYRRGGERKYLLWEITKIQMQSSSARQCSEDSPSSLISQAGPQQMLSKDKWNTTIVGKGKW